MDEIIGNLATDPRQPVSLNLFGQDNTHVAILGCSGSGKTNSLSVILEGLLRARCALVVLDVKGGGLEGWCIARAGAHGLNARWLSSSAANFRYDPSTDGSPAQVADKLIGAFDDHGNGEIYRLIGQRLLALVIRAMACAGRPTTIRELVTHLARERLPGLAHAIRNTEPVIANDLLEVACANGVTASAIEGLRARLSVFLEGAYGSYLENGLEAVPLSCALTEPGLTYIALPALASTRDTRLMGRMLIQDLKQAVHRRLKGSTTAAPAYLLIDEFAELDDPSQIVDLLRQSREANVGAILSSQQLPTGIGANSLRAAMLSSGTLLVHRLPRDDAEVVSRAAGEVKVVETTRTFLRGNLERTVARPSSRSALPVAEVISLQRGEAFLLQTSKMGQPARVHVHAAGTGAQP